jgi:hypothetical protein
MRCGRSGVCCSQQCPCTRIEQAIRLSGAATIRKVLTHSELYLLGEATRRPGVKAFVDASRGCNLVFFADASARHGNVVSLDARLCGIAA